MSVIITHGAWKQTDYNLSLDWAVFTKEKNVQMKKVRNRRNSYDNPYDC